MGIRDPDVPEQVVVHASALLDVLVGTGYVLAVLTRLAGVAWAAPAHVDADVLSALGRLCRAGRLTAAEVDERLALLGAMPLTRHPVPGLLAGAWTRRADLRLADAVYVELAEQLRVPLVTTDQRLARATPLAEAITAGPGLAQ